MRLASLDVGGNALFLDQFLDFRTRALDLSANGVDDGALGRFLGVLAGEESGNEERDRNGAGGEDGGENREKREKIDSRGVGSAQNEQNTMNSPAEENGVVSIRIGNAGENLADTPRDIKTDPEETSQTSLTSSALPPVGVVILSASSDARTSAQPPSRASIVHEFRRERAQSARPAPEAQKSSMFGLVCNPGSSPHRTQPRRPRSCDLLHNSANLDMESNADAKSAEKERKKASEHREKPENTEVKQTVKVDELQEVENHENVDSPESALSGRLIDADDAQKSTEVAEIPIIPTSPILQTEGTEGGALRTDFQSPAELAEHVRKLAERVVAQAGAYLEQFPLFSALERLELSANPLRSAALLGGSLCLFSGLKTLGLDGIQLDVENFQSSEELSLIYPLASVENLSCSNTYITPDSLRLLATVFPNTRKLTFQRVTSDEPEDILGFSCFAAAEFLDLTDAA